LTLNIIFKHLIVDYCRDILWKGEVNENIAIANTGKPETAS
jgi:hypothetical protein